jgi:hypothetical protein
MTLNILKKVARELRSRRIPATLEYPGVIEVRTSTTARLKFGDVNEMFRGDLLDDEDNPLASYDSSIPSNSEDIARIADFIEELFKEEVEFAGAR